MRKLIYTLSLVGGLLSASTLLCVVVIHILTYTAA